MSRCVCALILARGTPDRGYVQMETFESPEDSPYKAYDAAGNVVKGDHYDPESNSLSAEFKRPPY